MPSPYARRTGQTLRAALALALLVTALLVGPLALPARAEGTASNFVVDANLSPEGVLRVRQTITFSGAPPAELTQRFELREDLVGDRQYVQRLGEMTATAGGASVSVEMAPEGRFATVTVPTNGARELVMTYTLTGAVVNTPGGPALRARLLQGLSAGVTEFLATVQVPTQFTYLRCTAGPPNTTEPCDYSAGATTEAQTPTFRDGPRGPGEVVAVDIGFPPGSVNPTEIIERRWTLGRAFSADPLPLALALGLLVLGGLALFALHRRAGSDTHAGGDIAKPGDFVPVGEGHTEFRVANEIRPGHIGTVVDERVDPVDITATLLDLAVRGHLLITELPRESEFARTDWLLTRQRGADELRPFENALLDGIAPHDEPVRVSQIADRVQASLGGVQDSLYDEVVAAGWYERRPDATRNRWTQLAFTALILAVAITGVLVAFTTSAWWGWPFSRSASVWCSWPRRCRPGRPRDRPYWPGSGRCAPTC